MPSEQPTTSDDPSDGHTPTTSPTEEPLIYLDLDNWAAERCNHRAVVPPLPNLHATITLRDHLGWATLPLHWTGTGWAPCGHPTWDGPTEIAPRSDELKSWTEQTLTEANAIPRDQWLETYRNATNISIERSKARIEWSNRNIEKVTRTIQQAECAMAIANETDTRLAAVAQRLWPTWSGTAGALMAVAHELCRPATNDGYTDFCDREPCDP